MSARLAGADESTQKKILDMVAAAVPSFPLSSPPPAMGRIVYRLVREVTGSYDPFKEIKDKYNRMALDIYPELKERVAQSPDRLLTALRLAIAGNIIDFGVGKSFNLEKEIDEVFTRNFAIFDYEKFKQALNSTDQILYLADNAGEAVLDKLFIETVKTRYKVDVSYIVRSHPALNDVTVEEARQIGIAAVARVVENGINGPLPGTLLHRCSPEVRSLMGRADLIISKGGGNFETFSNEMLSEKQVTFMVLSKCAVYQRHFGVAPGDPILANGFGA